MNFSSTMAPDPMIPDSKILVVGTTEDYVAWLREAASGEAIFLVDEEGRSKRAPSLTPSGDEIITDLNTFQGVWNALNGYLSQRRYALQGIVCFDCEYMALTARLATRIGLSYPPLEAILNCRDKFLSKSIWQRKGVPCPEASQVSTLEEALRFFSKVKAPSVLKPLTGSGSELVFFLKSEGEVREGFHKVKEGLEKRAGSAMYGEYRSPIMVMERFMEGEEYSCDFMIEKDRVDILRLARKRPYPHGPFGTTWAYLLLDPSSLDSGRVSLGEIMRRAASALGIGRAICMADFIMKDGVPHLLEMTPRPGGDCLPHLLKAFFGFDMLKLALDFSTSKPLLEKTDLGAMMKNPVAGVRIFADKKGTLKKVHTERLVEAFSVADVYLKYPEGHLITLPPEDYDSWILGHVAIHLDPAKDLLNQLLEIKNRIRVEMAP